MNEDLEQVRWYVMRAYKNEKKAEETLGKSGLEHYIPKKYVIRTYHGVKGKYLVPAIPGLVFVHASREQLVDFKKGNNFLQFVIWKKSTGPECIYVRDGQMEDFIKVSSQYEAETIYFGPQDNGIAKGSRVRVHGGPLDGIEGTYMKVVGKRNRRVVIELEGVLSVAVEVAPDLVEVIG